MGKTTTLTRWLILIYSKILPIKTLSQSQIFDVIKVSIISIKYPYQLVFYTSYLSIKVRLAIMSDDPKDNSNQNTDQTSKKEVSMTDMTPNDGVLKGKKTDIQNPELWEFPMNYPLSIIGHEGEHESLLNEIKLILGSQFPDFDLASIEVKPSRTGRFHSARVNLYLTEADQVNKLYASLDNAKTVRMVL